MSAVLTNSVERSVWGRTVALVAFVVVSLLVLYRDTVAAMVAIWSRSETFAHAFLVAPIVLWLIWRQREALAARAPSTGWPWLLAVACAALLWLAGELASVNAATQLALVAMLVFSVPALVGNGAAATIVFPLAFAFFAVPLGEFLMPQMMLWTADFTVAALHLTGVPVYREGLQLVIPTGHWSVVEACSGVRYLIASVMVGTLFAYLNYRSTARRIAFVGVSIAVPIVANWVRAYLIVMTGHLSGNELAAGADHLIYGWIFFGIVIAAMFAVGMAWAEPSDDAAAPSGMARLAARGEVMPRAGRGVALSLLLVAALPRVWVDALEPAAPARAPQLASIELQSAGWQAAATSPAAAWRPAFSGAAAERRWAFAGGDRQVVGLYIGYWRHQDPTNKMVSSENTLVTSSDKQWRRVSSGGATVDGDGRALALRSATLRGSPRADASDAERVLAWQVYWVNGTLVASDWQAKLWGAWHKLLGRGDDAAVLIFFTADDGSGKATDRLAAFVRDHRDPIERALMRIRDGG
jgi:exosortase A